MDIKTILDNFKSFEADIDFPYEENIVDHSTLPLEIRETIQYLEEEMCTNISYFTHILTQLASVGFKWKYHPNSSTYQIKTSHGNLSLM